jgi:hypothetical protein
VRNKTLFKMSFLQLNKESENYKNLVERAKSDNVFCTEFLREMNTTDLAKYAASLGVSMVDIVKARTSVQNYKNTTKALDFEIKIEKLPSKTEQDVKGRGFYKAEYTGGVYEFFQRAIQSKDKDPDLMDMIRKCSGGLAAMLDIEEGVAKPVSMAAHTPSQITIVKEPLAAVASVVTDKKIKNRDGLVEFIHSEWERKETNLIVAEYFQKLAPPKWKGKIACIGGKYLVVPPVYEAKVNAPIEAAESICQAMSRGIIPSSSAMAKFCDDHVYGVKIPNDVRRYVDFLTDLQIPKDVTTLHLHTGDAKYAVGLYHMYPKLNLVMKGKMKLEASDKSKIKISYDTEMNMLDGGSDNTVMGIFFDFNKVSHGKQEDYIKTCIDSNDEVAKKCAKYKYYFRYNFVFAVNKEKKLYRVSCGGRDLRVVETNVNPMLSGKEVIVHTSLVVVHYLGYPFICKPLVMCLNSIPDLREHYSLKIDKKLANTMYETGFITFASGQVEYDEDFRAMCEAARKIVPVKKIKEEEEEEDDSSVNNATNYTVTVALDTEKKPEFNSVDDLMDAF